MLNIRYLFLFKNYFKSFAKRHKLVKNESEIRIPRYLFLDNLICDSNELKQPKRVPKHIKLEIEKRKKKSKEISSSKTQNIEPSPRIKKIANSNLFDEIVNQTRSPLGAKNLNSPFSKSFMFIKN